MINTHTKRIELWLMGVATCFMMQHSKSERANTAHWQELRMVVGTGFFFPDL